MNLAFKLLILGSGEKHAHEGSHSPSYKIDIDPDAHPDIVGSVIDPKALAHIPDNYFDMVLWENIPCDVLCNTTSFDEAYRILKIGGIAKFNIPLACSRLVPLLLQETKFRDKLDPKYGESVITLDDLYKLQAQGKWQANGDEYHHYEEKMAKIELKK